jgi:hypothetical protein
MRLPARLSTFSSARDSSPVMQPILRVIEYILYRALAFTKIAQAADSHYYLIFENMFLLLASVQIIEDDIWLKKFFCVLRLDF